MHVITEKCGDNKCTNLDYATMDGLLLKVIIDLMKEHATEEPFFFSKLDCNYPVNYCGFI